MSVDLSRGLLFLAAYGNNTVGIVDLKSGRSTGSIGGLSSPQGVAWVPEAGRLFVSNAGDGTVDIFAGTSFTPAGKIALSGDADNLRYDSGTRLLYVGYGSGGIAAINATSDSVNMVRALPAHPEGFQVETSGRIVFVNVPPSNLIATFDKVTGNSISNRSMTGSNFPMSLDENGGRLFVGTRSPSALRVLDASTPSLTSLANVTIAGDPDDIFYDAPRGLVYVSCGAGSLEVIKQLDRTHYSVAQTIPTGLGARTSLWVPEFVSAGASSTSSTSVPPVPTSPTVSVSPAKGPSGLLVTLSGSGYSPEERYHVCVGTLANASCGIMYTSAGYTARLGPFALMGSFVADSAGNVPAETKVAIPDLFGGNYSLGVVSDGEYTSFVSTPFIVETPTLSIGRTAVAPKTNVTLTGGGYAPWTTYTVCMVLVGTLDCGYIGDREETPPGIHLGTFTADANGSIPPGTKMTIPSGQLGDEAIGVFVPSGGFVLITQVQFTLAAST
jgi:hypothetical protein